MSSQPHANRSDEAPQRRHDDRVGPHPQRRGSDTAPERPSVRAHLGAARFRSLKRPLIGLGLAGMALPMVQATSVTDEEDRDAAKSRADDEAAARAASTLDTEDQVAERIGVSREEQARNAAIDQAVARYDISEELAADIYDIAREQEIEPRLAYGLVKTESTFDERAVSHVGARGLTQVMPRTAAWLVPGTKTEDLYNRQTNLRLGFKYLNQMIDKYKGDVRLALLAYNRGPGTVDKVLKRGGDPDNGYADKVLRS